MTTRGNPLSQTLRRFLPHLRRFFYAPRVRPCAVAAARLDCRLRRVSVGFTHDLAPRPPRGQAIATRESPAVSPTSFHCAPATMAGMARLCDWLQTGRARHAAAVAFRLKYSEHQACTGKLHSADDESFAIAVLYGNPGQPRISWWRVMRDTLKAYEVDPPAGPATLMNTPTHW